MIEPQLTETDRRATVITETTEYESREPMFWASWKSNTVGVWSGWVDRTQQQPHDMGL